MNNAKWENAVRKALIDRDMSVTELAEQLGRSRQHVSGVIHGYFTANPTKEAISDFLKIKVS